MNEEYRLLDVLEIEFDTDNPRIKKALEKYGDEINAKRINFALRSSSDDSSSTSTFSRLRDSIHANGGITQPITVVDRKGKKVCIDGNTRLAIYKEFLEQSTEGDWSKIRALVVENASAKDIETIRVSAHLVGPRPWPAYEKARYLHYLYHQELMDSGEMVALCGGNSREIQLQIDAYEDMNTFYRDVVEDSAFHIDRFSGFVQLQNKGVKDAIFEAGYELKDFGEWIRLGQIYRNKDVRDLPTVLRNNEAKEIFVSGGLRSIEQARKYLDRIAWESSNKDSNNINLQDASNEQLAQTLATRLEDMPFSDLKILVEDEKGAETLRIFEDLRDRVERHNNLCRKVMSTGCLY